MPADVSHLPQAKQREVKLVTEALTETATIELLILFGSHARNDWVEDSYVKDGITFSYQSDYDFLVIVRKSKDKRNTSLWHTLETELQSRIATPLTLIVDTIDEVNRRLREGHYFYGDIKREGIVLFDSGNYTLADRKQLSAKEQQTLDRQRYTYWLAKANDFWDAFAHAQTDQRLNNAAFDLHQVTEALLTAVLLVETEYKPKSHNVEKLLNKVATIRSEFRDVFPRSTPEEQRRFKLLVRAYVDARYEPSYTISAEQLTALASSVQQLFALTQQSAKERLAQP